MYGVIYFSKTLVTICEITWHHNLEDSRRQQSTLSPLWKPQISYKCLFVQNFKFPGSKPVTNGYYFHVNHVNIRFSILVFSCQCSIVIRHHHLCVWQVQPACTLSQLWSSVGAFHLIWHWAVPRGRFFFLYLNIFLSFKIDASALRNTLSCGSEVQFVHPWFTYQRCFSVYYLSVLFLSWKNHFVRGFHTKICVCFTIMPRLLPFFDVISLTVPYSYNAVVSYLLSLWSKLFSDICLLIQICFTAVENMTDNLR